MVDNHIEYDFSYVSLGEAIKFFTSTNNEDLSERSLLQLGMDRKLTLYFHFMGYAENQAKLHNSTITIPEDTNFIREKHCYEGIKDYVVVYSGYLCELMLKGKCEIKSFVYNSIKFNIIDAKFIHEINNQNLYVKLDRVSFKNGWTKNYSVRKRDEKKYPERFELILDTLFNNNFDPLKLPPDDGRPGAKAKLRDILVGHNLFISRKIFDETWQNMRKDGLIKNIK